jgi:hypothetical protein
MEDVPRAKANEIWKSSVASSPEFFIVKTGLRVLFTNLHFALGKSAISCLESDGLLFSSGDIAFTMSDGGLRVSEEEVGDISSLSDSQTKYFTGSAVSVSSPSPCL